MSLTVLAEKPGIFPACWGKVLLFRGYREVPLAAACAICRLGVNGSCCSGILELTAFIKVSVLRCLKSEQLTHDAGIR